jgi:hypothetical protein
MAYLWFDQELDNLRSAFRWASDQDDVDIAARIASRVSSMAVLRVRNEALNWPSEIVDAARRVGHRRLGALLTCAAIRAWNLGSVQEATLYAEKALSNLRAPAPSTRLIGVSGNAWQRFPST